MNKTRRYAFKSRAITFWVSLFDAAGTLLAAALRFFQPRLDPSRIRRILVIRLDALGDVVMTRPAIAALWRAFPGVPIDLVLSAENAVLFDDAKEVRNILPVTGHWFSPTASFAQRIRTFLRILSQIRKVKYDLAIDFRGDLRHILLLWLAGIPYRIGYGITGGGFFLTRCGSYSFERHQVDLNLALLEFLSVKELPVNEPFTYSGERKRRFWNLYGEPLARLGPVKKIVLHAGAGYPSKRWPPEKYDELVRRILEASLGQIVLIGTEHDREVWRGPEQRTDWVIDLRGKTRVCDLPILYDAAQVFVGGDSGPAHIAAAQGLESVVLFSGTNDARVWHPWTVRLHLQRHSVDCSPCEERVCPLGHHDCMNKISVDEVFETIRSVLTAPDGRNPTPNRGSEI
ncbi:MAG: glycosyltransferase family 9 protein [Candidatus Omnitrophota bacterium]|jgi:lipopolysaccharide heptosyltransferase II